ncbi:unnamed protein product, partial [marine sediment metagenome]
DDYYFQDFGDIPEEISVNQLLQQAQVQYRDEHWVFTSLVQGYQSLHPVNRQEVLSPYSRLPMLSLSGSFPDAWKGFDFTWHSEGTYYNRSDILDTSTSDASGDASGIIAGVNGGRFEARPGIGHPFNWIWGFFDPKLQFDVIYYTLQNQMPPQDNHLSRSVPMFDIHSGLFFERNINLLHHSYEQTFEPELYYLYVPFRSQNDLPNFDSGIIPFTYSQMFSNNRFSGLDRIGDSNQLTLALTTRFINNQTGDQKFRLSVGDTFYFQKPQTQLCNTPGC